MKSKSIASFLKSYLMYIRGWGPAHQRGQFETLLRTKAIILIYRTESTTQRGGVCGLAVITTLSSARESARHQVVVSID